MGHDTTAYNSKKQKIASIQRGAYGSDLKYSQDAKEIYRVLDCKEYNRGVSGCGASVEFSKEEIQQALDLVNKDPEFDREREFLKSCLDGFGEDDEIIIEFA